MSMKKKNLYILNKEFENINMIINISETRSMIISIGNKMYGIE